MEYNEVLRREFSWLVDGISGQNPSPTPQFRLSGKVRKGSSLESDHVLGLTASHSVEIRYLLLVTYFFYGLCYSSLN